MAAAARAPLPAALVNFTAGTAVLVVVAAVTTAVRGPPASFPPQAWLYAGGVLGIPVVGLAAVAVRWTGVLLLGMATVAGQIITALALDAASPVAQRPLSAATILGCAFALASVAAIAATR